MLFAEAGKKLREEPHEVVMDFEKASHRLAKRNVDLSSHSLKKLWELVTGKRRLSMEARNRLALFAGFQTWDDLMNTVHGDTDASINYEE
jgi:hypothetical protein